MLTSMTGFGLASASDESLRYSAEVKSLNGKYFKAAIRLPEPLSLYEPRIEQILRKRLIRGSVVYILRMKDTSEHAAWEVNLGAIKGYLNALAKVSALTDRELPTRIDLPAILLLPGVCQMPELDPTEQQSQWEILQQVTHRAVDQMIGMRQQEGQALQADLEKHCQGIKEPLVQIRARADDVVHDYAQRLHRRVQTMLSEAEIQLRTEDLVREVAIFAERADINEELARLDSHLAQFQSIMAGGENVGRRLEFLAQEMLRETNTIGSKANDAAIAHFVVEIKGHIDRIKEQVLNVV